MWKKILQVVGKAIVKYGPGLAQVIFDALKKKHEPTDPSA